jgi:hypothetical protein
VLLERHVTNMSKSIQDLTSRDRLSINEGLIQSFSILLTLGAMTLFFAVTLVHLQQQLMQITDVSSQMCQSLSHCLATFKQQQEVSLPSFTFLSSLDSLVKLMIFCMAQASVPLILMLCFFLMMKGLGPLEIPS